MDGYRDFGLSGAEVLGCTEKHRQIEDKLADRIIFCEPIFIPDREAQILPRCNEEDVVLLPDWRESLGDGPGRGRFVFGLKEHVGVAEAVRVGCGQ